MTMTNKPKYKVGDVIHGWEVTEVKPLVGDNRWYYYLANNGNKMSGDEKTIIAVLDNYSDRDRGIDG